MKKESKKVKAGSQKTATATTAGKTGNHPWKHPLSFSFGGSATEAALGKIPCPGDPGVKW